MNAPKKIRTNKEIEKEVQDIFDDLKQKKTEIMVWQIRNPLLPKNPEVKDDRNIRRAITLLNNKAKREIILAPAEKEFYFLFKEPIFIYAAEKGLVAKTSIVYEETNQLIVNLPEGSNICLLDFRQYGRIYGREKEIPMVLKDKNEQKHTISMHNISMKGAGLSPSYKGRWHFNDNDHVQLLQLGLKIFDEVIMAKIVHVSTTKNNSFLMGIEFETPLREDIFLSILTEIF